MMTKGIIYENALINFVHSELKNPTARFVGRKELFTLCPIHEYDRENPVDNAGCHLLKLREAFEFESKFEFPNKTMQFIEKSCDPSYQREDRLFSLQDSEVMKELFHWHRDFEFFWNGSVCPVHAGIHLETAESPVNVEFSFSIPFPAMQTVAMIKLLLPELAAFDKLNPPISLKRTNVP